jgi:hypothetical protein
MTEVDQYESLIKAIPPDVLRDAYRELASPPLRQFGRFGEDVLKSLRLVLLPIQLFAALQDRVDARLDRAIRQVPEERLIAPNMTTLLTIAEKLRFEPEQSVAADLYVNLLSRAMDGERVGEAHPAFVSLVAQLAPDEVLFLQEVAKRDYTLILKINKDWPTPSAQQIDEVWKLMKDPNPATPIPDPRVSQARFVIFDYSTLNQPELFSVFLEHLESDSELMCNELVAGPAAWRRQRR